MKCFCIFAITKSNNMTTLENNLLAVTNSEIFRSELRTLKMAEEYRIAITNKFQPLFDAILTEVPLVYNPEFDAYRADVPMTWANTYQLEDECFKEILRRKEQIQIDNGYDYDFGYCVILKSESGVRESIFRLIAMYCEADETYSKIHYNLEIFRKFKAMMIDLAKKS